MDQAERERLGRVAFEAHWASSGHASIWEGINPVLREPWYEAAEAVIAALPDTGARVVELEAAVANWDTFAQYAMGKIDGVESLTAPYTTTLLFGEAYRKTLALRTPTAAPGTEGGDHDAG